MKKVRLGFDFDGTLTKWPPLISFITSMFSASQTPKFIFVPWWRFLILLPIFLDIKRLEKLKRVYKDYDLYLITGRRKGALLIEQMLFDYDYDVFFKEIVSPKAFTKLSSPKFKETLCKAFNIDWYFDDNRYTVSYLRKKGIKAVRI